MATDEKQFYADAQAFTDEILEASPVTATFLGDHRYDDRLADYTPAALKDLRKRVGRWLKKFEGYRPRAWPLDAQIDRTLMVQIIKGWIRDFDKLRTRHRDPGEVVNECLNGVYLLILRDFAPLPERMRNILGRLRQAPRVLAEGRALIAPREVPRLWAEIALESAQQGLGLFAGFVPRLAEATPDLKAEVVAASQAAAGALQEHAAWIEQTVMPRAAGDFAVGKRLFDEILRESHMVDYDADELRATGWRLFGETERQMKQLAAQIDPHKSVKELLEDAKHDHPTAEGLLDAYRQAMDDARRFVIERDIASIPAGESIRIDPTPPFLRPVIPYAAYVMPGWLEKFQEGVFIVTPVDEGADAETAEKKLRGHPLAKIPLIALHEAYPGHHLQLTVANTLESLPRKLSAFLSPLFIEGWAFYCEELMERLGFTRQPIQRLERLQAQLWRAARIILDASLHTRRMTVDQAIAFLVERAGLEPDDAKAEVRRYTQTPGQPQSYLMGKQFIVDIVAEYERRHPEASLRQMHDAILQCGSLPPRLMRLRLFGEDGRRPSRRAPARKTRVKKARRATRRPTAKKVVRRKPAAKAPAPKKTRAATAGLHARA
jgi:uncharacterized protein (DUF885 family)